MRKGVNPAGSKAQRGICRVTRRGTEKVAAGPHSLSDLIAQSLVRRHHLLTWGERTLPIISRRLLIFCGAFCDAKNPARTTSRSNNICLQKIFAAIRLNEPRHRLRRVGDVFDMQRAQREFLQPGCAADADDLVRIGRAHGYKVRAGRSSIRRLNAVSLPSSRATSTARSSSSAAGRRGGFWSGPATASRHPGRSRSSRRTGRARCCSPRAVTGSRPARPVQPEMVPAGGAPLPPDPGEVMLLVSVSSSSSPSRPPLHPGGDRQGAGASRPVPTCRSW